MVRVEARARASSLQDRPGRAPGPGGRIIDAKEKALAAALAAQEKKGQNPTIIDLEGKSSYTDFIVIVTAYSERQTAAIADGIVESLREQRLRPLAREGQGSWILLDYGDVVVHVFHEDTRAFYDLDRLWASAKRVTVPPLESAPGVHPIGLPG
jgi:ribosome-associated protein